MSKDQMIQEIIEITAHNMDWFIAIIGVTVALFALFQWKFTDKQIDKMKSDILNQVNKEYETRIKKLEDTLTNHQQYQNNRAMLIANSLNDKFFKLETCRDSIQESLYSNDIINTIKDIVKNDMVDDITKVAAMSIVDTNIENAKRNKHEFKINSIHNAITNDDELNTYYQASKHLFENLGKGKSSNNK